jgi:hypothetical protein
MPLFLITRTDECGYDEFKAVLLRAADAEEAMTIATTGTPPFGDYNGFQADGGNLKCEEVASDGPSGHVIGNFRAG